MATNTRNATKKTATKKVTKKVSRAATKTAGKTPAKTSGASAKRSTGLPSLGDLGKLLGRLELPGIDVKAIVDYQRKDMEALVEANRQAYEGIKALAKRRNEMLREALVDLREAMKDAGGKDMISKNTERARQGVKQAIENFRELAEMEAESRRKAWKVLQDRFQENLASLQGLLKSK
jgi:phasin family protein